MISKCNEELSPHHHSEAVRIGFLRIKRTVILADRPIFVPRDCVSRRASGGPSTSSDLTRQTHNSSRKWRRNPLRRRWMPSPTSTRRGPRTTPCSPRAKDSWPRGSRRVRERAPLFRISSPRTTFLRIRRPAAFARVAREFWFSRETNAGSGAATAAAPCDIRRRAWNIPAVFR